MLVVDGCHAVLCDSCIPLTSDCRLVIVAKTNCPFCIEIMRTFDDMGMNYVAFKGERVQAWDLVS